MVVLLVIIAILVAIVGLLMLSQATMGVGTVAFACLCAILARVAQASAQHKAMIASIERQPTSSPVATDQ